FACYTLQYRSLFFFSSRRRHTRFSRDWSSDVCSSDLILEHQADIVLLLVGASRQSVVPAHPERESLGDREFRAAQDPGQSLGRQIGRASCRERVELAGVAGSTETGPKGRRLPQIGNYT